MMGFFMKLFGLESKTRGVLVGYRTYLVAAGGVLANLAPVLVGLGAILGVVVQFVDGSLGLGEAMAQIKTAWLHLAPSFDICLGFIGMAYARAGIAQHIERATNPMIPAETEGKKP
jgi:hypothetical protein